MTCPRCESLRRRVAELQAEVDAWERYWGGVQAEGAAIDRIARWCARLGLQPAPVWLLQGLAERAGRVVTREHLVMRQQARPGRRDERGSTEQATQVHILRARRRFAALGLPVRVETVWGLGYRMSAADARRLLAFVGEAPEAGRAAA